MEEDDDSDAEWQHKKKERKKRLLRVLRAQALRKLDCAGEQSLNGISYQDGTDGVGGAENLSEDEGKIEVRQLKSRKPREKKYADIEDDDYLLESIHKIKHFVRRLWSWALCYTQYCYPGLRSVEYYKKVKDKHCNKKKKSNKSKKGNKKDKGASTGAVPCSSDQTNQTEPSSLNQVYISDDDCSPNSQNSSMQIEEPVVHSTVDRFDMKTEAHQERAESSWRESAVSKISEASHAVTHLMDEKNQGVDFGNFFKWMCILLAPAVFLLGVHYVILRRKYHYLSRKLKKVRDDNDSLVDECNHLEQILSSTENIEMPFSTKESREEVVNEFTKLAESRMRAKNELSQMATKKMALLEELKTARKQRDNARQQYDSLTNAGVAETLSGSHLKTQATV